MIERLVLYATLGFLLNALGQGATDWGFWCVLALTYTAEYLARQQGEQAGVWMAANLPIEDLKEIQAEIKKMEQDESNR
jgi:hypothetical protein